MKNLIRLATFFPFFIFHSTVFAAPGGIPTNAVCLVEDAILRLAKLDAKATPFCSSFLRIPTVTKTATATSTPTPATSTYTSTSKAPTSTAVATATSTVTVSSTSTYTSSSVSTLTTSSTLTATISCYPTATAVKLKGRNTSAAPSPTPACFQNLAAAIVSTACSCLSVPTPTVTSTTTSTLTQQTSTITTVTTTTPVTTSTTITSTTTVLSFTATSIITASTTTTSIIPTSTVAGSLSYFAYYDPYSGNEIDSTYFKNTDYYETGTISDLNIVNTDWSNDAPCTLPGHAAEDCSQLALVIQGYLYASQGAGTYILTTDVNIDNILYVWSGETAYSSWDNSNYDSYYVFNGASDVTASYTLTEGEYLPITILYANTGGPGEILFTVTLPDGTTTTDESGTFVPATACDGSNAFTP